MRTSDYKLAARRALYIAVVADAIALIALAAANHEISPAALILAAPVFLLFDLTRDLGLHWYWDSWTFWPISALLVFPWDWLWGFFICVLWFHTGSTRMASNPTVEGDARKSGARPSL
jgi:hypothetical protein